MYFFVKSEILVTQAVALSLVYPFSATIVIIYQRYMSQVGVICTSTTQIRYTPWAREFCASAGGRWCFTSNMLHSFCFPKKLP